MKKVTLTFDNGPDPSGTTGFVLDEMARRGILASFFVVGRQLARPARAIWPSALATRVIGSAITR